MTAAEFTQQIGVYWTRTPVEGVLQSIREKVASAPESALKAMLDHLKDTVPPNQMIGVSHVIEAARATGSALYRRSTREIDHTCEICGYQWPYSQGERDCCPRCNFPAVLTFERAGYERTDDQGRSKLPPESWWAGYQRAVERAKERLTQGGGGERRAAG